MTTININILEARILFNAGMTIKAKVIGRPDHEWREFKRGLSSSFFEGIVISQYDVSDLVIFTVVRII